MSEQSDVEELNSSRAEGYGDRLKAAREEKKISIADIASHLRLDEYMIQALENYDYAVLPEPMFVCGYIRNYAKFLNLQPEPLIELYKKEVEGNLIPRLDVKNESRKMRSYRLGKFLPILFLLIVIAIVFAGWQLWQSYSTQFEGDSAGSWFDFNNKITDKDAGTDGNEVDTQKDPNQLQLPEYIEEPLSEQPLLPQINETPTQINETKVKRPAAATEPVSDGSVSVSTGQQVLNQAEQTLPEEKTESVETEVDAEIAAEPNSVQKPVIGDNKLVLDFSRDSWIRIRDADGNILAKDLKKKGTHLQLEGKKPFKVFLGDATGVTVSINNTVFDHSGYINDKKIARFEVK